MDLEYHSKKLIGSEDERAVSPVIGVILMVAITVILAAVIAAFVLDIGDLDDSAPNAQYNWESNSSNNETTVTHQSGDDIDISALTVQVTVGGDTNSGDVPGSADLTAGDSIEITTDGVGAGQVNINYDGEITTIDSGYTHSDGDPIEEVVIIWESDGSSTIITDYEP